MEDFGKVTIDAGSSTKPRTGQDPLKIYYQDGILRGNVTSEIKFYTPSFLDNAGLPQANVHYPNAYLSDNDGNAVLVLDVPAQRVFNPNIVRSSLKRSQVGIVTEIPITSNTRAIRYSITGNNHPLVAKVYLDDDSQPAVTQVLSSNLLGYNDSDGHVTAYFNVPGTRKISPNAKSVKAELRLESLTNPKLVIVYPPDNSGYVLGDLGTMAYLGKLELIEVC